MELIARDRELADVLGRLSEGRRLVSVVGPGGIGKTTLARAVVRRLAGAYAMGAHVVELSRVDRPDAVSGALAAQLGFSSFDVLLDSPADLPALVLVDNCEHVADAAADTVASLLDACDAVTVLATSRSPLAVPGESIVALAPLPVPPPGTVDAQVGAVRLFCERARDAGVAVDDDLDVVSEICRRLDGMPLAIELAAARVRVLAPADLLERLSDGVDVLARSRFRGAPRHRSVHDTITWSVQLLDEADQAAFARLGICAGPFTIELAAAVTGIASADAVDVVERLVDASLVDVDREGPVTQFRLLEPIRAVAHDDLEARDEVEMVTERLATHVFDVTAEMLPTVTVCWGPDLLPTLIGRFDQMDVALRYSLVHDTGPTRALVLYSALWGVVHQARVDEVLELGSLVIDRWPDTSVPYGADAAATYAMGKLLCGHLEEAEAIATAALPDAAVSLFAPAALRRVLGLAARIGGDHERAERLLAEAAVAAAEHGIVTMDLECQVYRAQDLAVIGRAAEALAIVRAVAEDARDRRSIINEIWARTVEASVLAGLGEGGTERADALRIASETLAVSESIAYPFGVICNVQTLAACHLQAGDVQRAAASADRLLDAVARSGSGDLRRALAVAAAVLAAADRPEARDLAATAGQLPDTNPLVFDPGAEPIAAAGGRILDRPAVTRLTRRCLAEIRSGGPPPRRAAPEPAPLVDDAAVFLRSGDVWQVRFGGVTVHLQTSKGMEDLAWLLGHPGREIHCLDLAGAVVEEPATGDVIDATARRAYEARLRDLQAEIEEAEANHDRGRAERAQAEMDDLVDHLTAALGLAGKSRQQGATAERARSAVTHRIRGATRRIRDAHPALGRHLDVSLTTGTYCSYRPEVDVVWRL